MRTWAGKTSRKTVFCGHLQPFLFQVHEVVQICWSQEFLWQKKTQNLDTKTVSKLWVQEHYRNTSSLHCMQGYVTLTWKGSLKATFAEPAPPLASASPWLSHALARQSRSSRSYALHFSWMLLAPLWVSPLVGPTPACRAVVWQWSP